MALLDRQTIKPGQPITARILNEFVRARELFGMLAVGPGLRKELRGRQITIGLAELIGGGKGTNSLIVAASISSIGADVLTCSAQNFGLGTISVARPELLRQTGIDGQTINYPNGDSISYTYDATDPEFKRTADDGSSTVTQIMTPNYYSGEIIYVAQAPTSLSGAPDWIDLNVAGRHWAEQI